MKNPVTHSVYEARTVQKKHQTRLIILLAAVILLLLGTILFIRVTAMKEQIDELYPAEASGTEASLPAETSLSGESSAESSSAGVSGTDSSAASSDAVSPTPTDVPAESAVLIPESAAIQTISHKARDSAYHDLQKSIQALIDSQTGVRCGFYYINLSNKEEFGYNDMEPFTPGSAINLAFSTMLYDQVKSGSVSLSEVMSLEAADIVAGSGTVQSMPVGTQLDIRRLSGLSMTDSDNTATSMLLRRLGGIDAVNANLKLISDIIDFRTSTTYTDYAGAQRSGLNRTSAQDLAKYTEYFYTQYSSDPAAYQPLFNDLANSGAAWGIGSSLPSDVLVCHKTGTASDFGCETDTALVFAEEPIVICVMVEGADPAASRALQQQLGTMVYDYLHACYS